MKRINGLDALRGIAVLLVILTHWGPHGFKTFPILDFIIRYLIPSGEFGVDLFFVLSGFLITRILLVSKEEDKPGANISSLKVFMVRRALRIFPVYYLLLLLLYLFNYPDIRQYFGYFSTYTSNFLSFKTSAWNAFSHTWTLSVEEQFYLVWPLFILFTPGKYLFRLMVLVIVLSTIIDGLTRHYYGDFAFILPFNCFNAFGIGGLYALTFIAKGSSDKIIRVLKWLLPAALILYILQYITATVIPVRLADAIIAINLIIYVTEQKYGRLASFVINSKPLNSLGKISYGVYLFHYIVPYYYGRTLLYFGVAHNPGSLISKLLYTPVTAEMIQFAVLISLSYLSFYCFEAQVLKLKKYYKYQGYAKHHPVQS